MADSATTPEPLDRRFEIPIARWAMWMASFVVFLVVMSGHVRYTEGDSRYALLASTALIEHGSLRLDPYAEELDLTQLNNGHNWMIFYAGGKGHRYYDYPIGTPVFSVPYVFVARLLGMNPLQREDDTSMQIGLAAILCALAFLLLFRLSNLYLGDWAALIFSLAVFFGSTLTSTMGTALWSQDWQTIFMLLIMLELGEWERGKRPQIRGAWLGALLFAAYLCRPTSSALIVPVFAMLAVWQRKALPWAMGVAGGMFAAFVLWSWLEMGTILPRYYDPTKWQSGTEFWAHWLPLWFGPARGVWAFTPVMLLVFGGWAFKKIRFSPLHLVFWVWMVLHTILLARSQSPWGGWSFGPRFFTEIIPGMALVLLLMADQLASLKPRLRNAIVVFFVGMSGFGIYVHTLQGLNNTETMAWNDSPNIDQHWKDRRWDWRHPQFLASWFQRTDLIVERGLAMVTEQALKRMPDGAALLLGSPDPIARDCFARWNRQNRFGRHQMVYNSLHALQQDGHKEFYFSPDQRAVVLTLPNVQIDSSAPYRICFGEYLAAHKNAEIVVSAKDDCTTGASLETRAYMRSIGSRLDSVKLRQSYVAHIKYGKLIYEDFGDWPVEYDAPGPRRLHLTSMGLFHGNKSSIDVDGQECSLNQRGLNVVVLDDKRKVVWITNFDTHGDDNEWLMLMKAKL